MTLIAIPYHPFRGTPEAYNQKNGVILDWLAEHPLWFNAPIPRDELYALTAKQLASGEHCVWEVWDGGKIVGLLALSRIFMGVDALCHFTFWGCSFFTGRRIVHNFLGWAFDTFHLQRISIEVPESNERFWRVMRREFNFRFEGELDSSTVELAQALVKNRPKGIGGADSVPAAQTWLAKFGSRREKAHWNGKTYVDVFLLRLLREEYERSQPVIAQATQDSIGVIDEPRSEAGTVFSIHSA